MIAGEVKIVEVDTEFLRNYVRILDSLLGMTRDKLVFQQLAIPFLGDGWKEKFEKARSDPRFLGEYEMHLAEIQEMRKVAVGMLDQLLKGDPAHPPNVPIN
jgi:hypothetical protein